MDRSEFERRAVSELDAVYRFARFLTRDAARAEDLVQDVYVKAFASPHIDRFESRGGGMRAWLLAITRSRYYTDLGREESSRRTSKHMREQFNADDGVIAAPTPEQVDGIDWNIAGPTIRAAMDDLGDELREVLWLWAVEGMKYREISVAMEVPIGTVMSRLHRARSRVAATILSRQPIREQLAEAKIIPLDTGVQYPKATA